MKYKFIIPGVPVAQHRKRITTRGKFARVYTVKADIDFRKVVQTAFFKFKDQSTSFPIPKPYPIAITLIFIMPIPASYSAKKRTLCLSRELRPITKPDNDNLEKAIWDGLNGHAWHDDSQIVDNHTSKYYGEKPMTMVEIEI